MGVGAINLEVGIDLKPIVGGRNWRLLRVHQVRCQLPAAGFVVGGPSELIYYALVLS
jgi:hypothetical protein